MGTTNHSTVVPSPLTTDQTTRTVAIIAAVLTTPEAAAYLNLQPTTLEQWRWNGRGPRFSKLGRSVRYRKKDLDDFLEARVFSNTTEAQAA